MWYLDLQASQSLLKETCRAQTKTQKQAWTELVPLSPPLSAGQIAEQNQLLPGQNHRQEWH